MAIGGSNAEMLDSERKIEKRKSQMSTCSILQQMSLNISIFQSVH